MVVQIQDDFDLDRIAGSGQCFRWEKQDGGYRIVHRGHCLWIRPEKDRFRADCTEEEYANVWHPYFDLDTSYAGIRGKVDPAADPYLAKACRPNGHGTGADPLCREV